MPNTYTEWSIGQVPASDRTDAWQAVLSSRYRGWGWEVPLRLPAAFHAHVRSHDLAGLNLVETVCDPCIGQLRRASVRRDDELYVGVQLTTAGRERCMVADARVEVATRDILIWTTDSASGFEVMERLHKITLMIPWFLLRDRLSGRSQPPLGGIVDCRTGVGSLLASHLLALSREIPRLDPKVKGSVARSTLELLGIVLSDRQDVESGGAGAALLRRIQDYILQHLHEDGLTPARIAQAHRISLRYLYALFQRSGATVSGWILERRLHACKQALQDPAFGHCKVTEIAFRWGFNSASHFCRAFKEKYGCSPSDARRVAAAALQRDFMG